MDENNNQNTEQQPTTQPADNGNQGGGKMFTQEEVNQIVKERLARERAKTAPPEPSEEEKRQADLEARENKLFCREYVLNNRLPSELLDLFDTSDYENFAKKAGIVSGLLKTAKGVAPLYDPESGRGYSDGYPEGFKNSKHVPKNYPY